MIAEDLKKLRTLAESATPGPWRPSASRTGVVAADGDWITGVSRITPVMDVEFIAASRAAVPALLDEIAQLLAQVTALSAERAQRCSALAELRKLP